MEFGSTPLACFLPHSLYWLRSNAAVHAGLLQVLSVYQQYGYLLCYAAYLLTALQEH
jgi:hypothetical protein